MSNSNHKWLYTSVIWVVITFFLSISLAAEEGYQIVSSKGKMKTGIAKQTSRNQKSRTISLKKGETIMLYEGTSAKIKFPDGTIKTLKGPLYSAVESLQTFNNKPISTYFEQPDIWNKIKLIFDEEGETPVIITKGNDVKIMDFYHKIKKVVDTEKVADRSLSSLQKQSRNEALSEIHLRFPAFSPVRQTLIEGLVRSCFGSDKEALSTVFKKYETLIRDDHEKSEREILEDFLVSRFLPLVVTLTPPDKKNIPPQEEHWTFKSNIKLWWSVFYYNGNELKFIKSTIDYSINPQEKYELRLDFLDIKDEESKTVKTKDNKPNACVYIVASADWTQLERYDDLELAKKELLYFQDSGISSNRWQSCGRVIIGKRL